MDFLIGVTVGIGLTIFYHLSKRNSADDRTEKQNHKICKLVENSKDIIYYYQVKPELKFKYISRSLDVYLGPGVVNAAMENPYDCFERSHPDDVDNLHDKVSGKLDYSKPILQRWRGSSGRYLWFEEYATPVYENGEMVAVQGVIRNIDEKIKLQEDLEYQISHDVLTGIYNRSFFEQQLEFFNSRRNDSAAIILCDLDNLKVTNDSFGHKHGDRLLIETARVLQSFVSSNISVSRIGGDEFAILLNGKSEEEIINLVHFLQSGIEQYNQEKRELKIEISIGHAHTSFSKGNMEELMTIADKKMYEVKRRKKELSYT